MDERVAKGAAAPRAAGRDGAAPTGRGDAAGADGPDATATLADVPGAGAAGHGGEPSGDGPGRADAARRRPGTPGRARAVLWVALALPLSWLLGRWAGGAATYGEVVSQTGAWAALLLVPTTFVTPLGHLFPQARSVAWLRRRRHDLGVACVGYAVVHTAAYAVGKGSPGLILREAHQPWLLAGWGTLAAFMAFAAIRARAARRGLRPSWTRRHRIFYLGAALVAFHWLASAFDPLTVRVQTALRDYGYYEGPIDGVIGPLSRQALARLQRDRGLAVTGAITPEVLDVLGIVPN